MDDPVDESSVLVIQLLSVIGSTSWGPTLHHLGPLGGSKPQSSHSNDTHSESC